MKGDKISIVNFLRTRMQIIAGLTLLTIISFIVLLFLSTNSDYESRVLINILGKQRMYTQTMAKNATRIYALKDMMKKENPYQGKEIITSKLKASQKELYEAMEDFDRIFSDVKKGYVKSDGIAIDFNKVPNDLGPVLEETDQLWGNYKYNINIILSESETDNNVVQALGFINENNQRLLVNCDIITNIVVESTRVKSSFSIYFTEAIAILSIISMIFVLFNIYKYLFLPLEELYDGIARIGLARDNLKLKNPGKNYIAPIVGEVNNIFLKLNKLISLTENINKGSSFIEILNYIYKSFASFIPYSHIGIALINENEGTIKASYGISDGSTGDLAERLSRIKIKLSETSLGKVIDKGEVRVINDLEDYTSGKPLKLYNKYILESGIKSSITLPLTVNNRTVGVIFFSAREKNIYNEKHIEFLRTITNSIALSFEKSILMDEIIYASIMSLAKLAESRDSETGEHLNRMKVYSRVIAEILSVDSSYRNEIDIKFIEDIERFSPLHDIGKVAIRDEILLKPGRLTEEEFEIMKTHAVYGARVLRAADENVNNNGRKLFTMGVEIAEGHHEKWDGSGYPYGRREREIPLSARIVAVADVFDALTSIRPYKRAWTLEEALNMIYEGSGKHFDPEIVRVVLKNKERMVYTYNSFNR